MFSLILFLSNRHLQHRSWRGSSVTDLSHFWKLENNALQSYKDPSGSLRLHAPLSHCSAFLRGTKSYICFPALFVWSQDHWSPGRERAAARVHVVFAGRGSTRGTLLLASCSQVSLGKTKPRDPNFPLLGPYSLWRRQTMHCHSKSSTFAFLHLVT